MVRVQHKSWVVVTDLDASLLDADYSFAGAMEALNKIHEAGFPLVFNSSKTLEEMRCMVESEAWLWEQKPILIGENGTTLGLPRVDAGEDSWADYIDVSSVVGAYLCLYDRLSYKRIVNIARGLREEQGCAFRGFADLTVAELTALTGLDAAGAARAQMRNATEPILWEDGASEWTAFEQALSALGIRAIRGGQFIHLMEAGYDKSIGVTTLRALLEKRFPSVEWAVLAIGDSPNDQMMLEQADSALVIPNPKKGTLKLKRADAFLAEAPASVGWNAAVLSILNLNTVQP